MKISHINFEIVHASGTEIGIRNTGKISINVNELSFYSNDTLIDVFSITTPPSGTNFIEPGQVVVFNMTQSVENSEIKVTGPFGVSKTFKVK